jgi:hypothetical protein
LGRFTNTPTASYIRNNTITRAGGSAGAAATNAIRVAWSNGIIVENNTITGTNSSSTDGNDIIIDDNDNTEQSSDCIVRYNYCGPVEGGTNQAGISAYKSTGTDIYSNIVVGPRRRGITVGEDAEIVGGATNNTEVYHNTIINVDSTSSSDYGIWVRAYAGTVTIKNNLVYNSTDYDLMLETGSDATLTADYNRYGTKSANWSAETNGITDAPDLDSETYRPNEGSPVIGAGIDVGVTYGYDGGSFGDPPNIGALGDDTIAPVLSAASPAGAQNCTSNPRNVTISATATDYVGVTACRYCEDGIGGCGLFTDIDVMPGPMNQGANNVWSATFGLACGVSKTYWIKCEDAMDNESAALKVSFSIDAQAPQRISFGGGGGSGGSFQ